MTRSGIHTQLGVAEETTYGTYVAPARFLEFVEEGLTLDIERNESKGLRSGQRVLRQDHWQPGKRSAGGDLEMEVGNKGFGLIFKHVMGAVTTSADGLGKKHSCSIGELFGDSLSLQVGRPDVSAIVQPFSYLGCKVDEAELAWEIDEFVMLKLGIDAQDETTAQALGSATAPTETELFHWSGTTLTVGGSAFDAIEASVKVENGIKKDRHHLRGARLKKEPIEAKRRVITGKLVGEFENLTAYNRFVNGTHAAIVITTVAVATYDTSKPYKLVVTLNSCRFDGKSPAVKSEDVLEQELPFTVVDDGTNPVMLIDYYTLDATP